MQTIDFDRIDQALNDAEITMVEAESLYRVTRQTLYNWKKGRPVSNDFIYNCAMSMTARIKKAVEQGLLPLPEDVDREARLTRIREKLSQVV